VDVKIRLNVFSTACPFELGSTKTHFNARCKQGYGPCYPIISFWCRL